MHHACGLVRETADALTAIERALSDGSLSPVEFMACEAELAELEARIPVVRAGLRNAMKSPALAPLSRAA
ncbi:hypothetical protein D3C72_2341750 [compost metagenome]